MKSNYFLKIYLLIYFIISVYLLNFKFLYPTDWTTSEWLINYQGGFVRRGLIGEILFQINKIFEINLRFLVYYFQIFLLLLFYLLFYFFIKNIKFNYYLLILFLSPALLIFSLAANDVLVRKETLLFISYIIYLNILSKKNNRSYIFVALVFPLLNLIWDGVIFYICFFISIALLRNGINKGNIFKIFLSFVPYLVSLYFILFNKTSYENISLICNSIKENCFGAIEALDKDLKWQINYQFSRFNLIHLIRFLFLILLTFFPIFLIFYKNYKKKINIMIAIFYIICISHIFIFFIIGFDWGRWINITYTLSFIKFCFLIKEKILKLEKIYIIRFIQKSLKKKKLVIIIIFLYLTCWNIKSTMTDTIGTFPYLRVINKIKHSLNYNLNF